MAIKKPKKKESAKGKEKGHSTNKLAVEDTGKLSDFGGIPNRSLKKNLGC